MKIEKIRQQSLHNEEWFKFFTEFIATVTHFNKATLGITDLFNRIELLYQKVDELLVVIRKSLYTEEIEAAVRKRNELFRGLFTVVKGMQKLPGEAKQKAAERLFVLLDRGYKKTVLTGTLAEQSASVYNLLQDLSGAYAADMTLLALTEWVTLISQAEKEYQDLAAERAKETIQKPQENLAKIRREADVLYNAITVYLDARLTADALGGDTVIDPRELDDEVHMEGEDEPGGFHELHGNIIYNFVITWNLIVKKYHAILAQRTARRAKNEEPGEEPGEEEA
ncbi:MAG: DUF6261 family protein [Tannerellaceae bacterium]|jgi:hypothetical protein|nr:DUF6261 family protein [Tannerellaceae bacterium]